ncbi:unnamed protein product [Agarophyton chilense]
MFDRLPRIMETRCSLKALHKYTEEWFSTYRYGIFDPEEDISKIVLEGVLSSHETPVQTATEKVLLQGNQHRKHLNHRNAEASRKQREHLDISSLVLFYLLRGICVDVIASLLKELAQPEMVKLVAEGESVDGLVHSIGNSILALSLRLTRSLTENHVTAWGVALKTRVCHETDGIELLLSMHLKEWKLLTIHLVSVRRARGAATVVSKILDSVSNDWRRRIMGISSGIPSKNRKAKKMEKIFFEELQEIDNIENNLILVDTDLPMKARPIYADVLADMSEEEFGILLQHHQRRLRTWFEDDEELEKLKEQWKILCSFDQSHLKEATIFEETWPSSRRIRSIMNFAQVLSALWKYDDVPSPKGCSEVSKVQCDDRACVGLLCPSMERIHWARTFVNLIQEKSSCFSSTSLPQLGSQWASNWSNWEVPSVTPLMQT